MTVAVALIFAVDKTTAPTHHAHPTSTAVEIIATVEIATGAPTETKTKPAAVIVATLEAPATRTTRQKLHAYSTGNGEEELGTVQKRFHAHGRTKYRPLKNETGPPLTTTKYHHY